jgi:uncharacterized protein (DUF58 family)
MPEPPPMSAPLLFDETTRRKLEQLTLSARRVRAGMLKGERRSTRRGSSNEFADYRNYAPGDDLRRLDWNIYARLERPLMKVFEDEEDLSVYVLIDTSASMSTAFEGLEGDADAGKFLFTRRLAAGLAYLSLHSGDRLTILPLGPQAEQFGPVRGRSYAPRMLQYFSALQADGAVALNDALRDAALRLKWPGLVVVLSDLFAADGALDGLTALLGKGCEVALLHVLTAEEVDPSLAGDLRLVDSETGQTQEVSLEPGMLKLYRRRLEEWREGIRNDCTRRGIHYVSVQTDRPWEKVILEDLRRLGVVK